MTCRRPDQFSTRRQLGMTIVENLIAIALLGIVLAGSSRAIIYTLHSNQSARGYSALASDVQKVVDGYRQLPYATLLGKFDADYGAIVDGQTTTESLSFDESRSDFVTTFTALRSSNTGFPEAVKVNVAATQRRAKLGDSIFTFETYIAQVR